MTENQMEDRKEAPPVINTVDNYSRVHAAQINALKYLIFKAFCSVVPLFVFLNFKKIQDPDFNIIYGGLISFLISMLIPTRIQFVFRYIIPILIIPYACECEKSGIDINTSYFGKTYEHNKDLTLFLLPVFSTLGVYNVQTVFGLLVFLFQRWSFQFRQMRIIGYIVLCLVNAVIFSYLLYLVIVYFFYGWFYFIVRYDLDNSTLSVEVTDILRNKDHVLKPLEPFERTMSWEICRQNGSHSWTTTTGFDATFEGNKLPVCRSIYYRVEGEDVDITCKINNTFAVVDLKDGNEQTFIDFPVFNRFEWDLGKSLTAYPLKLSAKVKAKNKVEMILRITDLTAGYFNHEIILWGIFNTYSKRTFKVKFGSFFINKQKEIFNYIHVPQGHILSLNAMPFYSFSETDDHFVFHSISSIVEANISGDTNAVCSDIFKGCGPMIHVLYNMSKVGRIINKKPLSTDMMLNSYSVATKLKETGIQIAKSYTCVCENGYGQHTYSILRNLYNTSSKSTYISEIKLPYRFFVLPRGLTHFAANKYKELQNAVRKAIHEGKNDWRNVWLFYVDDQRFYYFIIFFAEYIIMIIIIADVVMMIHIFFKVYCKVFVGHFAKVILKPKFPLSICDELFPVANANIGDYAVDENISKLNDIMIIASDNDYDFAIQNLIPFFKSQGMSVLLPQTDINGGQSNIYGYSQAVATSVMYVVVGTRDFENDPLNNNFILSNLILPQIYEQRRNQHKILIIKFNDVNIPRPLRWNEHVTIADWSTRQSDDDNLRRLKNKLKSMTEALFMT